jgi:hypothetical protein
LIFSFILCIWVIWVFLQLYFAELLSHIFNLVVLTLSFKLFFLREFVTWSEFAMLKETSYILARIVPICGARRVKNILTLCVHFLSFLFLKVAWGVDVLYFSLILIKNGRCVWFPGLLHEISIAIIYMAFDQVFVLISRVWIGVGTTFLKALILISE